MEPTYTLAAHMKALLREGVLARWSGYVWVAFTAALAIREAFADASTPALLRLVVQFTPPFPIAWWLVSTFAAALAWCFGSSYVIQRKALGTIAMLRDEIAHPERVAREQLLQQISRDRAPLAKAIFRLRDAVISSNEAAIGPMFHEIKQYQAVFTGDDEFQRLWNDFMSAYMSYVMAKMVREAEISRAPRDEHARTLAEVIFRPFPERDGLTYTGDRLIKYLLMKD